MQTYVAKSMFNTTSFWMNVFFVAVSLADFLVLVADVPAVKDIIPAHFMPHWAALIAVANIWRRQQAQRPARWIAPGTTQEVLVETLPKPTEGKQDAS